jgi:hypothetical protein
MLRVHHIKDNAIHYFIYTKPVNNSLPTTLENVSLYISNLKNRTTELTQQFVSNTKLTIKQEIAQEIEI